MKYVKTGMKILEIGTGPYAILPLYLSKKIDCSIEACDINNDYIRCSAAAVEKHHSKIKIFQSDLFENVNNTYDIIFFNSVYIPDIKGERMGINKLHNYKTDWSGGSDGMEIIEKFISESGKYLNKSGKVILGVNYFYLDKITAKNISLNNNFNIEKEYKKLLNPSCVLILNKN